jgi:adenine/guanine phosphoribosyltransferase-like PRPP-binding protein
MIKQVSHTVAGTDAAGFALALEVAYELHAPTAPVRAPEISPVAAHRAARARSRRTVRG